MNTPRNRRKHATQMTATERLHLTCLVHLLGQRGLNGHSLDRCREKGITLAEVQHVLKTGQVIEVHENFRPDVRAVVRGTTGTHDVCVVLSLCDREVKTVWFNNSLDTHRTLDYSQYQWQVDGVALADRLAARHGFSKR